MDDDGYLLIFMDNHGFPRISTNIMDIHGYRGYPRRSPDSHGYADSFSPPNGTPLELRSNKINVFVVGAFATLGFVRCLVSGVMYGHVSLLSFCFVEGKGGGETTKDYVGCSRGHFESQAHLQIKVFPCFQMCFPLFSTGGLL